MAITTVYGHCASALNFFENTQDYIGIGRVSEWADEENPPAPDPETLQLDEIIGVKKILTKYMVVPDEAGSIIYRDTRWRPISADLETVREEKCHWVFVETTINYDELPLYPFRQVGIFTHLEPEENILPGQYNLLPAEVADFGFLEVMENRLVVTRQMDQKETISMILEF